VQKFTLDIRPTFVEELDKTLAYIEVELENHQAADRLLNDAYAAIDEMLDHPTVTRPVYRPPQVNQPYYVIHVRNYDVFYIVHDDIMEVRWFRYGPSQQPLAEHPSFDTSDPYAD